MQTYQCCFKYEHFWLLMDVDYLTFAIKIIKLDLSVHW